MMKRYDSSIDTLAKVVPVLVGGMVTAGLGVTFWASRGESLVLVICTTAVPLVILIAIIGFTWRARIKGILLDDNAITIERSLWPATIKLSDIKKIRPVNDMTYAWRTFGNGGMFGYTGTFYKKSIGSMQWFCSQRRNYVLIETVSDRKIVITPDERDEFLRDISQSIPYALTATEIEGR